MLKPGLYAQIISQSLSRELASVSDAFKHVEKLDAAEAPQALAGYVAEAVRAALEAMPVSTEEQAAQRIKLVNKVLGILAEQREDISEKAVDDRAEKLLADAPANRSLTPLPHAVRRRRAWVLAAIAAALAAAVAAWFLIGRSGGAKSPCDDRNVEDLFFFPK